MKSLVKYFLIFLCFSISIQIAAQEDAVLEKLTKKDSIRSIKASHIYEKNVVTNEVKNAIFRNIYNSKTNNEEEEFNRYIQMLLPFDGKKIDTIIYRQFNILGENIYDTNQRSNNFEKFISKNLHINTKIKVLKNRFLLMQAGDVFSPYTAYNNARLIRSSGIFHDVRFVPLIHPNDTNHVDLIIYIQDVFPYGFSFSPYNYNQYNFGINNVNIAGWGHQLYTDFRVNGNDPVTPFGYGLSYIVPNIVKKQYINLRTTYQNYSKYENLELNISRQFSQKDFLWAGGFQANYTNRMAPLFNNTEEKLRNITNQLWYSRALPIRDPYSTINAFVVGVKFTKSNYIDRPLSNNMSNLSYWNSNFVLGSIGYSKIKYVQDRLINGFGRTEDIPKGMSFNLLYGYDFAEFGPRTYYGAQFLSQYYSKIGAYFNFGIKTGTYNYGNTPNQSVIDINLQSVSPSIKLGSFRLRNYFNSRLTTGIHMDSTQFITFNDYNGIRGINNGSNKGNLRTTVNFQSNLFIPMSFLGFRFSVFGLLELAKMNLVEDDYFSTPLHAGASFGVAIKNENLIFDVIQIQYGFYPSSDQLNNKRFLISSIIPFSFQSLDISKPNIVDFR